MKKREGGSGREAMGGDRGGRRNGRGKWEGGGRGVFNAEETEGRRRGEEGRREVRVVGAAGHMEPGLSLGLVVKVHESNSY